MKERYTEARRSRSLGSCARPMPGCRSKNSVASMASVSRYYAWKAKFGGMKVSDAQRLKALELENGKLKRLLANSMLEVDAMREVLHRK